MDSCPLWDMLGFARNICLLGQGGEQCRARAGQMMVHLSWLRGLWYVSCLRDSPDWIRQEAGFPTWFLLEKSQSIRKFRARLTSPCQVLGRTLLGWQNSPQVATACGRKQVMSGVWMCHSCEPSYTSQSSFISGQVSQIYGFYQYNLIKVEEKAPKA